MRSSGWQASTAENKEVPAAAGEVPPNEPIAKADIPDWLMSMAPSEGKEPATSEAEEPALALPAGEDGIPDWLKPVAPAEKSGDVKITSQEFVGSSFESGMIPMVSGEAVSSNSIKATSSVEPRSGSEDIPDWLKSMNSAEPVEWTEDGTPDAG